MPPRPRPLPPDVRRRAQDAGQDAERGGAKEANGPYKPPPREPAPTLDMLVDDVEVAALRRKRQEQAAEQATSMLAQARARLERLRRASATVAVDPQETPGSSSSSRVGEH